MLLLVQIWVAMAIIVWGVLLILVGLGTHGLSKSKLLSNRSPGEPSLFVTLLGGCISGAGLASFVAALGWSPLRETFGSLITGVLLLLGIQLATGHARLENDLTLTMLRRSRGGTGIFSRVVGAVVVAASLVLLAASLRLFGWRLSPGLIASVIAVCATLFATILVNVLTGSVTAPGSVPGWLPTAIGVVVFALLLSQTPLWPLAARGVTPPSTATPPAPTNLAPGQVEITSSKTILHVGEQAVLTVNVDPALHAPTFRWSADYGIVPGDWVPTSSITYTAPTFTTVDTIQVTVRDANGRQVGTGKTKIQIVK